MRRVFLAFLITLFITITSGMSYAAEDFEQKTESWGSLHCMVISWTSAAGGTFTSVPTEKINGLVYYVLTDPDDEAAPSDNYDITLKNSNGYDIMGGKLANRDEATTEVIQPYDSTSGSYLAFPVDGALTLAISDMGNSTSGVIKIYFFAGGR